MSVEFEQFRAKLYPSRDGINLSILDTLTASEREKIEALSIASLTPDAIDLIAALGHLRSQQAFVPLLELLPQTTGTSKVYVAEALWQIQRYEPAIVVLCETLVKQRNNTRARWMAAMVLRQVDDDRAIEALRTGLKDEDVLVHSHSQSSLAVLLGIQEKYEAIEESYWEEEGGRRTISSEGIRKAKGEQKELLEDALDNYDRQKSQSVDQTRPNTHCT